MPRAAVLNALNEPLEIVDLDLADPGPHEVRVRMGASGVCHSDLSIQNGTMYSPTPCVLGHEGAGVIEAIGEGVTNVAPGDHVVVSWVPQCGSCFYCTRGQGYLCETSGLAMATGALLDGTTRWSRDGSAVHQMAGAGTFAEAAILTDMAVVKIDSDIPLTAAALVGCGVLTGAGAALNTASIKPGDTVAVMGCGGVGLNTIQGAKLAGAERVIAIDMFDTKLEMARQFGATDVVKPNDGDAVAQVQELTGGRGADVAFEVIGLAPTIDQTIAMTRRGGQAILVGVPRMDISISIPAFLGLVYQDKIIHGCWYGSSNVAHDVPKLIGLYTDGKLKLDELISRRIGLGDVNEAFTAMGSGEVARSVIEFDA